VGEGPTAALLQQIFEVDPLACPSCHGAMRLVAFITQTSVIRRLVRQPSARSAITPYTCPTPDRISQPVKSETPQWPAHLS